MCGICGYAGLDTLLNIEEMANTISHRGPDGMAIIQDENFSFGFVRLAIVDIANGMQPFLDQKTGVAVIVNGEIYNHLNLKRELGLVHSLTQSDCEVVLHSYLKYGTSAFEKLHGMFAVAVWDPRIGSLFLARDRVGKKPLYWCEKEEGIIFSSELKAILKSCFIEENLDLLAVQQYFLSDSVPTPRTIFKGIHKLSPGTYLEWQRGKQSAISTFWPRNISKFEIEKEFNLESLLGIIEKSVCDRLMADVPIGILLSSGVDSTLIAALATKNSTSQLESYTLRFQGKSYDESETAQKNASLLGLKHTEIDASLESLAEQVSTMVDVFDEPLNDPAILPMLLMSKTVGKNLKVALSGDGGDELFVGYPHAKLNLKFDSFPYSLLRKLPGNSKLLNAMPDDGTYFGLGFKAQRLARGIKVSDFSARDLAWRGSFTEPRIRNLLQKEILDIDSLSEAQRELTREFDSQPFLDHDIDKWSWWYLRSYLMDTVLVKTDRSSMAFGLEVRSPLLDHEVIEAVFRIDYSHRVNQKVNKKPLADLLNHISPALSTARNKHGMGVPVLPLLRGPLLGKLIDLTSAKKIKSQGIFDIEELNLLVGELRKGKRDIRKEIWGIFVFQAWYERWVGFDQ